MYSLQNEELRPFIYRGYSLFCKPYQLRIIQQTIDKWETKIGMRTLLKPSNGLSVYINWAEMRLAMLEDTKPLWQLLLALGIISFQKNGNIGIRPDEKTEIALVNNKQPAIIFFTSDFHARMCLVNLFKDYRGRHLYRYDNTGAVIHHEEIW